MGIAFKVNAGINQYKLLKNPPPRGAAAGLRRRKRRLAGAGRALIVIDCLAPGRLLQRRVRRRYDR